MKLELLIRKLKNIRSKKDQMKGEGTYDCNQITADN